jgi:hypothetical protein
MLKKPSYIPASLILCIILLNSCSAGSILISVLQPASVIIPGKIKSISIFPVAGVPDSPGVFDSISHIALYPGYDYNITKKGFIYGIYDVLASSPRFQRIVIADSALSSMVASGIISWDLLEEICRHDSTDGVLLLKKAVTIDIIRNYWGDNISKGYDAWYRGEEYPFSSYDFLLRLINRTRWAFYQPDSQVQTPTFSYTDTIDFYDIEGLYTVRSYAAMREVLYDACFYTGSEVGKQLAPAWNNDAPRFLYTGPNKPLRKATALLRNEKWEEAGQIWDSLAHVDNKMLAFKASFNTALAWEQADDLDQALLWINYADSLRHNNRVEAYKKILKKRLQERAVLDIQMAGD